MKRHVLLALVLAGLIATQSFAADWAIDVVHSSVNFSVSHMVISKTRGVFNDFEGTLSFDGKDISQGSVTLVIQTASIDTDDERRDGHLKSAEFFDAEKFPTMTFVSTKVLPGEGKHFQLVGNLTIKETTLETIFDCEFIGVVDLSEGNAKSGFTATTEIDRQNFKMEFSKLLDGGGLMVGNAVTIELDIEANLVTEEEQQEEQK